MLRGFRWQVIALFLAVVLFAISLLSRSNSQPPVVDLTPEATTELVMDTLETPAPTVTAQPDLLVTTDTVIVPLVSQARTDGVVTYTEALIGSVQRLNPLFAGLNAVDADITSLIFEGLMKVNEYGEPVPNLAVEMPVISSDGLEYVVRLRTDVLWQDGIPFTAADVIFTMTMLRAPDFPGQQSLGAFWRSVETEQLGEHLVRFRLTQPLGSFLDALSIGLLPAHALQGISAAQLTNHRFNLTPIGTGPYQLEALRSADGIHIQQVDLRVAPVYRQRTEGQSGYVLDRVSFRLYDTFDAAFQALESGEVQGLAARNRRERPPLLSLIDVNPHNTIAPTLGALIFNWTNDNVSFFRLERVRSALMTGLDRRSLIERQLANLAVLADSPLLPGSWAYTPIPFIYSSDDARQQFANIRLPSASPTATPEATIDPAFTPPPSATPSSLLFTFRIMTPDDPALVAIAQEIAAQWSQYNLGVTVDVVDSATHQSRLESGDFEAAVVELSMGYSADPDVYALWHQGQFPPNGNNYGGANDGQTSELLERARQNSSGVNRIQLYSQFQRVFIENAVAIPLYYPLYTYGTSVNVSGVQLGFIALPSDRFRNIRDWTISG